jgi:hypothetical protein
MSLKKKEREEKARQLFIETASETAEGPRPRNRAFAASLTGPILKDLEQRSYMRELFTVERLGPGAQPTYQIAEEFDSPVWILPNMGFVAYDILEFVGEEVMIPTFNIQAAKDWLLRYAREGRVDVARRAQEAVSKSLAQYEEEAGWRTIIPAVTSAFGGMGTLPPRPAPIYEMPAGDPAAGYLSKELLNRMMVGMQRLGRNLNVLWVSPEDMADIREYTDVDVDPLTRKGIFDAAGLNSIWGINFRVVDALGVRGKYNINDKTAEFGPFKGNAASNAYNDYTLTHGNIVDINGTLSTAGETQIYGFDTSDYSLIMPIKQEYQAFDDPTLHRYQKQGFYGWEEIGMACIDARFLCMAIIDRYTP